MVKPYHKIYSLLLFTISLFVSQAAISGMILIEDNRYVSSVSYYGSESRVMPGSESNGDFFSVNTGYARQYSSFREYYLDGSGYVSETENFDTHYSVYDVTFSVDESLSFNLSGEFYAPYADAEVSVWENGTRIFYDTVPRYSSSSIFSYSGDFLPGNEYSLYLGVDRLGSAFSRYDDNWDFELSTDIVEVPLPASIWLMLSAMAIFLKIAPRRVFK